MADMSREERDEILALAERFDASNEIDFTAPECRTVARSLRFLEAALRLLAGEKGEPAAVKAWHDAIMEQAQVFASTYSLVGGRFDDGTKMEQSEREKEELRRMLTALVSPPSRSYAEGVEDCARLIAKRRDDYIEEHGNFDPETGALEFPGNGDEYVGELDEIEEDLRALAPKEG